MNYTYEYPRPMVTVDNLIFSEAEKCTKLLLIKRLRPPFEGSWALPGGFVDMDEKLVTAAHRELQEETSLEIALLKQFRTFGNPNRDPRGRTIAVVFYGFVNHQTAKIQAADDAADAKWFSIDDLPALAFDHERIVREAIAEILTNKH